jgi:hypothetical protein
LSWQNFTMVVRELEAMAAKPVQHDEPEIDYDRVVWDLDYRRHVVDELNRFHRPGDDRHDGHAAF